MFLFLAVRPAGLPWEAPKLVEGEYFAVWEEFVAIALLPVREPVVLAAKQVVVEKEPLVAAVPMLLEEVRQT